MLLSNTDREVCWFSRLCPNFPSLFYSWYVSISTFSLLTCVFRNGPSPFFLMHGNLTTVNHKEEISLKIVKIKPREKVFAGFAPGKSWHIHHLSAEQKQRDVSGVGSSMLNSSLTDSSQWDFHGSGNMILSILIAVHCRMTGLLKALRDRTQTHRRPLWVLSLSSVFRLKRSSHTCTA